MDFEIVAYHSWFVNRILYCEKVKNKNSGGLKAKSPCQRIF